MPTTGQGTPRGRPCGRPTVRRPRRPCSDRAGSRDSCSNCLATVTTVATARRLLAVAHLQRPCYNHKHLDLIIKRLCYVKLYINPKKYEFLKSEVKYLGFIINK